MCLAIETVFLIQPNFLLDRSVSAIEYQRSTLTRIDQANMLSAPRTYGQLIPIVLLPGRVFFADLRRTVVLLLVLLMAL